MHVVDLSLNTDAPCFSRIKLAIHLPELFLLRLDLLAQLSFLGIKLSCQRRNCPLEFSLLPLLLLDLPLHCPDDLLRNVI